MSCHFARVFVIPLVAPAMLAAVTARAAPTDYGFNVEQVGKAHVTVSLIHKPTGQHVSDAAIVTSQVTMGPSGKPASMTTRIKPFLDPKTGNYIFKIEPGMVVHQITLAAKVKSETDLVNNTIPVAESAQPPGPPRPVGPVGPVGKPPSIPDPGPNP